MSWAGPFGWSAAVQDATRHLAENMRENRLAKYVGAGQGHVGDICKTVGLAYVGSNPTPATTQNRSSELVFASFPSLSKKRSGHRVPFAALRSFCRSARRAESAPGRDGCATENTRRSLRLWTRRRRCGGGAVAAKAAVRRPLAGTCEPGCR